VARRGGETPFWSAHPGDIEQPDADPNLGIGEAGERRRKGGLSTTFTGLRINFRASPRYGLTRWSAYRFLGSVVGTSRVRTRRPRVIAPRSGLLNLRLRGPILRVTSPVGTPRASRVTRPPTSRLDAPTNFVANRVIDGLPNDVLGRRRQTNVGIWRGDDRLGYDFRHLGDRARLDRDRPGHVSGKYQQTSRGSENDYVLSGIAFVNDRRRVRPGCAWSHKRRNRRQCRRRSAQCQRP
jgi:hypothetical protein